MKRGLLLGLIALCLGCHRPAESPGERFAVEERPKGWISFAPDSPHLRELRIENVSLKKFPVAEVIAPGKLEVNPNRVSRVLLPVPGRVRRVLVALGDAVREGQPLVVLESREAAEALAAWRQAQAQLQQAQANLAKAEKDLERLRDLYQHRAAPLKDVLAAENELAQARAAVEQAEAVRAEVAHRLALLGVDPQHAGAEITVRAPISGKVLEISVAPGEYRTDPAAPLMVIADLGTLWATSHVPENQIRLIHLGEQVEIELIAFPGEVFQGRVQRIADLVDPQSRTVKVQAELANPQGRLRPEMFCTIRHTHEWRAMPVVPATAVVRADEQTWVFAERAPGRFERVPVECGEVRDGMVAILKGLKEGDRVVSRGAALLAVF
ncbi:MAG: efflux RND transporter periplasmic adaptor subunit [Bryobacterales bacterium]|nr:efflux RND transporter periplasmic adaptor subunit [Bryobacteraceae bacterium]MDW8129943.1 efflux RND transporter periplasmic adaptor subunit [Bryobacterales bacterium]